MHDCLGTLHGFCYVSRSGDPERFTPQTQLNHDDINHNNDQNKIEKETKNDTFERDTEKP